MEYLQKRIVYKSRADVFSLWFLGDLHLGSASCDEAAIVETVKHIKADPRALWVGVGDLGEFIPRQDWRARQTQLASWLRGEEDEKDYEDDLVAKELDVIADKLHPIAKKCLGLVRGNHEDKHLTTFGRNVQRDICKRLQVDNLTDEAWIRVLFNRCEEDGHTQTLDLYCHHGWFSGRKSGGKVNNLHDLLGRWNADIVAVGHGHERVIAPPLITERVNRAGNLEEWRRYSLMTGSFMRTHEAGKTSYASGKGFAPNDIGAVCIEFVPDKNRLEARV